MTHALMQSPASTVRTPSTWLLAALTGLTALSIDMSLPAMPQLQQVFHSGVSAVQLTLSLFLLGYAVGQLVCGPVSDRYGRRPVLLAGLTLFTLSGLLCAFSTSLSMLVAARLLQGIGASVGPIMARAIVRDRFSREESSAVLSQITQVMVLAPLLAPTIGGYLLTYVGWQSIFYLLVGSGVLLWVIVWARLPETRPEEHAEGAALARVGAAFRSVVSHQASLRQILTSCFAYAGMFAYISGSPFVLIDGFHVARQNFGYLFALTAAALMVGATVNRHLLPRHTPLTLLIRGVNLLLVAGLVLSAVVWLRLGGVVGVMLPMMGYLFSLGLVQPNATAEAMEPHGRLAGVASSLMGALQTLGGALSGYVVGRFYDHTPRSLAFTVGVLSVLAFLVLDRTRHKPETHEGTPEMEIAAQALVGEG